MRSYPPVSNIEMSWKFAELKWRQDVGLQESCWERGSDGNGQQSTGTGQDGYTPRRRSHTAPWSILATERASPVQNNRAASILSHLGASRILPDPRSSCLSPETSPSPKNPLLTSIHNTSKHIVAVPQPVNERDRHPEVSQESPDHFHTSVYSCSSLLACELLPAPLDTCERNPLSLPGSSILDKRFVPSADNHRDPQSTRHSLKGQGSVHPGDKSGTPKRSPSFLVRRASRMSSWKSGTGTLTHLL